MAANVAIFWQIITNSSNYFLSSYELDWRQYGNSLALCYIAVAIWPAAGSGSGSGSYSGGLTWSIVLRCGVMITLVFLRAMVAPGTRTFMCPPVK